MDTEPQAEPLIGTHSHPDLDPAALADLELIGRATEIEEQAKQRFHRLAEDLGRDVALDDMNRRVSRWAGSFDGTFRRVAYILASAMDGDTLQIWGKWGAWGHLTDRYARWYPDSPISERQFRHITGKLAKDEIVDVKARKNADLVAPDAPWPLHPEWQATNLITIHVGKVICRGQVVLHDWNAPCAERAAKAPRLTCAHCQKAFDAKRGDAQYCSVRCRKAASRVTSKTSQADVFLGHAGDVTDTSSGIAAVQQRRGSGVAPIDSELTLPDSIPTPNVTRIGDSDGVSASPSGLEEPVRPLASPALKPPLKSRPAAETPRADPGVRPASPAGSPPPGKRRGRAAAEAEDPWAWLDEAQARKARRAERAE